METTAKEKRMALRQTLINENALMLPKGVYSKKVIVDGKPVVKRTACFFLHGTKQLADFSARLM